MTENQTKQVFDLLTKCVNGIQEIREDVSVLKQDVSTLKEDVSILKQDVSVLKEDVSVLKADMSEVKKDISEMKQDISQLKDGQKRIEKEVRLNTSAINEIAAEQLRLKVRVNELEKTSV